MKFLVGITSTKAVRAKVTSIILLVSIFSKVRELAGAKDTLADIQLNRNYTRGLATSLGYIMTNCYLNEVDKA